MVVKAQSHAPSQTRNNLKITGTPYSAPRINEMQKIVIAKFRYRDPKSGKEFTVQKGWPCKDQQDAEHTVKYHGQKTGALDAQCVIEEVSDEEIKQAATKSTAKEAHQA
jgi:hypothetical protein